MNFIVTSGQAPPENCGRIFLIDQNGLDLYITPGVLNCFSCLLETVSWQIEMGIANTSGSGRFLLLDMPESYVRPGPSGRRNITCTSVPPGRQFQARLASPGRT